MTTFTTKKFYYTLAIAALCTGIMNARPAHAQLEQVENATQIADPARVGQDLLDLDKAPELSGSVKVKEQPTPNAPAGAENITFQLNTLVLDGVSAYNEADLQSLYQAKLGTTVTLADVYAISNALTRKYRNDGYILTQVVVPPQTIDEGVVTLRVVEGKIGSVAVQGDMPESERKLIEQYAANLQGETLDAADLERNLLLINDLPGVSARSVLSPSTTTIGASDLTIIVERDRYEFEASLNNHGSRYLGPYQGAISATANSALGFNERISAQFVMSGDKDRKDELAFGSVVYEQPVNRYGTVVRLVGSVTATEPGDDLDQFDVKGHSQYASAGLFHPIIRSRTMNWLARANFDLRDVESKNDLETETREDHIRALRFGTTWQFMDTFLGAGINAIDFEFAQGVSIFGATRTGQANITRAAGDSNFTKAEVQVQRLQRVTPEINVLVAGSGQWSATPLLSSEEFGVGGIDFGRGYDSSEIVGDDGIAGKIELQWNEPKKVKYITDYQLYGFFDIGRVWNQDATNSADKRQSLSSTGIGVRADITEETEAGFSIALPLTKRRDTSDDRDPRYYFNVSHKF